MENILEEYRTRLAPIVYDCLQQMYETMVDRLDDGTYGVWKELIGLLATKDISVTTAFRMCMPKLKEDYRNMVMAMFLQYERNPMVRNRS
jgi:hypothetical protein